MKSIITNDDLKNASYTLAHAFSNFMLGKTAGRVWQPLKPYADPRLILATSLMQTVTTAVLDRDIWESDIKQTIFQIAMMMLTNSLVLSVFHFSGTTLTPKGAALMTVISTASGIGATALASHVISDEK